MRSLFAAGVARFVIRPLLFALTATIANGCADDFERQSRISKLRALAVQAEPAELIADPNQPPPKTALTAFAVEPGGAPVMVRWALCTVQAAVPSPDLDCPGAQGIDFPAIDSVGQLDLGMEPFRSVYQKLLVGPDGAPPEQVRAQLAAGIPLIVGFTATAGSQRLSGLTTVTLRSADAARPTNRNPMAATLLAGDQPIAADGTSSIAAGATVRLTPIPAEGAHEQAADGIEKLNYSFYATDGEVKTLRSTDTTSTGQAADPSVDYVAPAAPGTVKVFVVIRDGHGGVGWIARSVQVR